MKVLFVVLLFILVVDNVIATKVPYFSGSEHRFKSNENIKIETLKLTSIKRALPFKFYKYHGKELPFCAPKDPGGDCDLGECLSGVYRQKSAYQIIANETMYTNTKCIPLRSVPDVECKTHDDDYKHLKELIDWEYRAQITLDGLPVAEERNKVLELGFRIGEKIGEKNAKRYILNNHLEFKVTYGGSFEDSKNGIYILGFTVVPRSINGTFCENSVSLEGLPLLDITEREGEADDIEWSYSVSFVNSSAPYDERWYKYFNVNTSLHWVSLSYAIIVAVVLAVYLAIVLVKIIHSSPISRFNFDDVEESGWKTLHGDVFRPPQHFMLLSVFVGTGAQILTTAFCVLLLGAVGFLSPAKSGSLNAAIAGIYPCLGFVAGYASARVYTRLGGARKRRNAVFTALGFNGCIFLVWFIAEIILWSQSSSAGSLTPFFALFAFLLFVHTPLVFLGSFFAHRRPVGSNPVGTNTIPRMIPPAPWYSHTYLLTLLLAILPYGISFNELYDIMDAMWSHHVYYFFGVVLVVFVLLTFIVAEVSVILCYFQLGNENYHWWWRAFYIPAAIVVSIFYVASMDLQTAASVFLYLMYTTIILMVFFVFMSSIAFYACWTFVHKIYSTLHVD